jgi:hypothetical protein
MKPGSCVGCSVLEIESPSCNRKRENKVYTDDESFPLVAPRLFSFYLCFPQGSRSTLVSRLSEYGLEKANWRLPTSFGFAGHSSHAQAPNLGRCAWWVFPSHVLITPYPKIPGGVILPPQGARAKHTPQLFCRRGRAWNRRGWGFHASSLHPPTVRALGKKSHTHFPS